MAQRRGNVSGNTGSNGTRRTQQRHGTSFATILKSRVRQPQFYWFLGHVMILYHFIQFHLSIFSVNSQRYHYNRTLLYIIITFGIVLYQFIRSKQLNFNNFWLNLQKLDNLQYFTLYSILYGLNVISGGKIILNGGIMSPTIFAIFHVLNYFKENLLPYMNMIPQRQLISVWINQFITQSNEKCLIMAQSWEIIIMFRYLIMNLPIILLKFILKLVFKQKIDMFNMGQIIMIISYIKFIRWRYLANKQYAMIFNEMLKRVEILIRQYGYGQFLPIWYQLKEIVIKYI